MEALIDEAVADVEVVAGLKHLQQQQKANAGKPQSSGCIP